MRTTIKLDHGKSLTVEPNPVAGVDCNLSLAGLHITGATLTEDQVAVLIFGLETALDLQRVKRERVAA